MKKGSISKVLSVGETTMFSQPRRPRYLPLLPVAPLMVLVIGIATAVTIALVAVGQLQRSSDEAAAVRSKALAGGLAARLRTLPRDDRAIALALVARRSGAEVLLLDQSGHIVIDQAVVARPKSRILEMLRETEGLDEAESRRARYAVRSLGQPYERMAVLVLVVAPSPAQGTIGLINAVGVLTLLLLGMAITVALVFMRQAGDDVGYVRKRIAAMADEGHGAAGTPPSSMSSISGAGGAVPVRSLDQVGLLTAALNQLIERFADAERGYREDLIQAAQLDNERSQFLAGLSHELRTPLNAILGFTHLLESEVDGELSSDAAESLAMIRTSGEHLKTLIDDILDLSAMETGQVRLSRLVVNVHEVADDVAREARATVMGRPIELKVSGAEHAYAWADPRRLRQVLTNLVSNALKATAEGLVSIQVSRGAGMVSVSVSDSGRGIEPAVLQSIFQPYRQAGDAAARRGGAGLGLAIARRLVELHGGSITATSEVGQGSSFTVTFPDETHSQRLPRDSLVPWSDGAFPIQPNLGSPSAEPEEDG